MTRAAIEHTLWTLDQAFDAPGAQPLLANLRSLNDDDWHWLPPGGERSIFDIVVHVGECKYVYDNYAFGDASMQWGIPGSVPTVTRDATPAAIIAWLCEGHRRLRASVEALADDAELLVHRKANWGRSYETRWLVNVIVQHDLYHGGEINHIRALRHANDRWPY